MLDMMNLQMRCRRRRGRTGFTLAEILVALGILAIGMAMVAAIFPAAMEFNRASTNDTLGAIICENGLMLTELALTAEIVSASAPAQLGVFADDQRVTHIPANEQKYPTGDGDSRAGFVMLARRLPSGSTFQLVTVAYRKSDKNNKVILIPVSCSFGSGPDRHMITSVSPGGKIKIGTPLINRNTGEFAFVDSINVDGTSGTLDIPSNRNISQGGNQFYVVAEVNASFGDIPGLRRSPAIEAMSKITGLRHDLSP